MLKGPAGGTVRFGECELDLARRELRRGGEPRHLTPRAFALLELLVTERPRALAKADLRERLWPETYVSNTALAQLVTELRKVIGDEPRAGRWIRTVFGFGYAFAGIADDGEPAEAGASPLTELAGCWLRWHDRILPLADGANIVGRGREAEVRVPVPEVSRRHARIDVTGTGAVIEDLQSRNGTFVRGHPVTGATPLTDGDEVGFGPEVLVFCASSDAKTTKVVLRRRR